MGREIETPAVSVVMPVWNGVKAGPTFLQKALETLRDQDYAGSIQVVIVDDGSTDHTVQWIKEQFRKWTLPENRIFKLIQSPKIGVTKALNLGIRECTADFIARSDADDYSSPTRVRLQVEYLLKHPQVGLVCSTIKAVDSAGKSTATWYYNPGIIRRELFRKGNPICHGSVMLRREALARSGLYNESYRHAQDYDLFWRVSKHFQLASMPDVLYFYRVHTHRVSADPVKSKIQRECSTRIRNRIQSELDNVSPKGR